MVNPRVFHAQEEVDESFVSEIGVTRKAGERESPSAGHTLSGSLRSTPEWLPICCRCESLLDPTGPNAVGDAGVGFGPITEISAGLQVEFDAPLVEGECSRNCPSSPVIAPELFRK